VALNFFGSTNFLKKGKTEKKEKRPETDDAKKGKTSRRVISHQSSVIKNLSVSRFHFLWCSINNNN